MKLVDIDGVSLLDKRGYLTICVSQVMNTIITRIRISISSVEIHSITSIIIFTLISFVNYLHMDISNQNHYDAQLSRYSIVIITTNQCQLRDGRLYLRRHEGIRDWFSTLQVEHNHRNHQNNHKNENHHVRRNYHNYHQDQHNDHLSARFTRVREEGSSGFEVKGDFHMLLFLVILICIIMIMGLMIMIMIMIVMMVLIS